MEKIILYYKFVPISDPVTVMYWQRELCERHGLKGRIIISKDGINGTLGGPVEGLKAYKKAMNLHPLFKKIMYKWSDGSASDFPKLSIKVRKEIVTFLATNELKINDKGVVGNGRHLKPEQVHKLIEQRGDDVVFMDGRNAYEAEVGKFKNAVIADTRTTRDFIKELEQPKMKKLKNKPIVTYCTGGIRCEILTGLMKNRGFKEVYQLEGGIAKYGEKYKDDGLWEGKLYVFDKRMTMSFSDKAKDIGKCSHCRQKTSNFINCADKSCNDLILACQNCAQKTTYCSRHAEALAV
ncbi:MAG TPA: rhodanese-related sulfurtransferase [Candidatus Saccharimonadales bacterium]|nr:rhodanese-related sulfurtransferase [Candidatus Saccharimonadales bacterium]